MDKWGAGTEFEFALNMVLLDHDGNPSTKNDQIKLEGNVAFSAQIDIHLDIDDFEIHEFEYAISKSQVMDLQASIGASIGHYDCEKTIATVTLSHYIVMIGIVPVTFQPRIDVILKLDIDGSVTVRFGYYLEETTRNGARYCWTVDQYR